MQRLFLLNVAGSWVYCDALIIAVDGQLVIPQTGENAATHSLPKVTTVKKIDAFKRANRAGRHDFGHSSLGETLAIGIADLKLSG